MSSSVDSKVYRQDTKLQFISPHVMLLGGNSEATKNLLMCIVKAAINSDSNLQFRM